MRRLGTKRFNRTQVIGCRQSSSQVHTHFHNYLVYVGVAASHKGGGRTGIKIWGTENQEAAVERPSEVGQSKLDYLYFENKY